jgi:uncharacterized protein with ATP-grasp and redox domains
MAAFAAGLDRVARRMVNGSDGPGTIPYHRSAAVRTEFASASLIVAKGQANYETLSECDGMTLKPVRHLYVMPDGLTKESVLQ